MADLNLENIDKDVLPMLSMDAAPQVRSVAMQIFLGLTGTADGCKFITSNEKYMEAIVQIAKGDQPGIAKDAYCALINLCTTVDTSWQILNLEASKNLVHNLIKYIITSDSMYADIVCSLLSNISRSERCSKFIVDEMVKERETIGFDKVIEAFCKQGFNPKNDLHYIGPFLSNLTQIPDARKYVLDKDRCVIQRLIPFTEYNDSTTRRGGIIGVLRNCCFETEYHEWLLSDSVDILPRLLLPLAGPEEFDEDDMEKLPEDLQYLEPDKTREPDPDIRKMLVECVNLLCSLKVCRVNIKEKNTYVIMRELFNWEKDPMARLATENLIGLLIGDEPEPGMSDLHKVEIPDEVKAKLDKAQQLMEQEAREETLAQSVNSETGETKEPLT